MAPGFRKGQHGCGLAPGRKWQLLANIAPGQFANQYCRNRRIGAELMGWLLLLVGLILSVFDWLIKPIVLAIEPLLSLSALAWVAPLLFIWLLLAKNEK